MQGVRTYLELGGKMILRSTVTELQKDRANQGMAQDELKQVSQAPFSLPSRPDSFFAQKSGGLADSIYDYEMAAMEIENETDCSKFGSSRHSISMSSDAIGVGPVGQSSIFSNALITAEDFEIERDNLASARGPLLALALAVPIWVVLFLGSLYLVS
jgi:hypothetical protein